MKTIAASEARKSFASVIDDAAQGAGDHPAPAAQRGCRADAGVRTADELNSASSSASAT